MKNYYKILGVKPNTSLADIKVSFRALALKWHPDRVPDNLKIEAHKRFVEINEAYSVLSDTVLRQQYNILYFAEIVKSSDNFHYSEKQKEQSEQEIKIAREVLRKYIEKAKALADSFSGDYNDSFFKKLDDAYETFLDIPFTLFDRLKFDKTNCPSIEEIIHFAYKGYGPSQEVLRAHIYNHIRFCNGCRKIHRFFTKVAQGASCPQYHDLRKFLNNRRTDESMINKHILKCERCKCIFEIFNVKTV